MKKKYEYHFTCSLEGIRRAVSVIIASNAKEAREELENLLDDFEVLCVRQEPIEG